MANSVLEARRALGFAEVIAERPDGTTARNFLTERGSKDTRRFRVFGNGMQISGWPTINMKARAGCRRPGRLVQPEMESHGAEVTAVDLVSMPHFFRKRASARNRKSATLSATLSIFRGTIREIRLPLFLGVLYHVRHPLLALDVSLTREMAIVDSFVSDSCVIDGQDRAPNDSALLFCEFQETGEPGGNVDNWFGPTVDCLLAFCRTAGFVRVSC